MSEKKFPKQLRVFEYTSGDLDLYVSDIADTVEHTYLSESEHTHLMAAKEEENKRLRDALEKISEEKKINRFTIVGPSYILLTNREMAAIAREALKGGK